MTMYKTVPAYLECNECHFVMTIHRRCSRQKLPGHIKHMYCPRCKCVTAHTECREIHLKEAYNKL